MSSLRDSLPLQRLDLRGLDPPEPMRRALEAVEALNRGEAVQVITDREPLLLYRELAQRGHHYVAERRSDGFRTTIHRMGSGSAS